MSDAFINLVAMINGAPSIDNSWFHGPSIALMISGARLVRLASERGIPSDRECCILDLWLPSPPPPYW